MFKFLKKKLKSWVKKAGKPEKIVKASGKTKPKKEKELKEKKALKKGKILKPVMKFNVGTKTYEPDFEKTVEALKEDVKEPHVRKSIFSILKKKLTNEKFDGMFQELELILIQNNVAYSAIKSIELSLKEQLIGKDLSSVDIKSVLKKSIEDILINPPDFFREIAKTLTTKKPYVICFVGINGSGKTTSIAKVAHMLKKKYSVSLAAADTFRAASIEQLQKHAEKLGVHLTKKDYGDDPASVGYEAITYAKKHHIDVVLIDTAGRMQNKDSLMREIEKISRVNKPDMKLFVGESITGNDATEQAKAFNDSIDLTGIILSKADVDEKGGTAISVSHITKKPIFFLGTGQEYKDLEIFNKEKVLKSLGL